MQLTILPEAQTAAQAQRLILREAKAEGRAEGRAEGEREKVLAIALRLVVRRMGPLDDALQARIQQLSSVQLEDLSKALLDLTTLADLMTWLDTQLAQNSEAT